MIVDSKIKSFISNHISCQISRQKKACLYLSAAHKHKNTTTLTRTLQSMNALTAYTKEFRDCSDNISGFSKQTNTETHKMTRGWYNLKRVIPNPYAVISSSRTQRRILKRTALFQTTTIHYICSKICCYSVSWVKNSCMTILWNSAFVTQNNTTAHRFETTHDWVKLTGFFYFGWIDSFMCDCEYRAIHPHMSRGNTHSSLNSYTSKCFPALNSVSRRN